MKRCVVTLSEGEVELPSIMCKQFRADGCIITCRNSPELAQVIHQMYELADNFPVRVYEDGQLLESGLYNVNAQLRNEMVTVKFKRTGKVE